MNYRKEIDGLRALAVIPVVLFHAGIELFSGGYLGVDVFFVISGYLITGIILQQEEKANFSFVTFYERRARRILPALSLVLLFTVPFSWAWLTPGAFESYATSLVAVTFFVSNILFWSESGYFDGRAEEKPLLHTWSLAVEEQYYIIFPIIMLLIWRYDRNRIGIWIGIIFITSLIAAEQLSKSAEDAAFFLLPTRAWELMAGAMIAFQEFRHGPVNDSRKGALLSLTGILLVLLSMMAFTDGTRHPSLYTLVPVLGTVLIIRYGRSPGIANRLLTLPVIVGIGLISYSLYLWHQPLFSFAHIRTLLEPPLWLMVTLMGVSTLLAYLSWRFVEKPFRTRRDSPFTRRHIFTYSTGVALIFIFLGSFLAWQEGMPQRFDAWYQPIFTAKNKYSEINTNCFNKDHDFYFSEAHLRDCVVGNKENVRSMLWGDSHANAITVELGNALAQVGEGLLITTSAGCLPIPERNRAHCEDFNKRVISHLDSLDIDILILHGRWTAEIEGSKFNNQEGGFENKEARIMPTNPDQLEDKRQHAEKIANIFKTRIQAYLETGKKIILVYNVPETGWSVPEYTLKSHLFGNSNAVSFTEVGNQFVVSTSYKAYLERNRRTLDTLNGISHPKLYHFDPAKYFCNTIIQDRCVNSIGNQIYYRDTDHVTDAGARLFVDEIAAIVHSIP